MDVYVNTRGQLEYNSDNDHYIVSDMSESHILNVLGKFELQRMVFSRLVAAVAVDHGENHHHEKRLNQINAKMDIFVQELVNRSLQKEREAEMRKALEG